jgi:glycosidase
LKTIQIPWKKLKWLQKYPLDNVLTNYQNILDGVLDFTAQQLFHQFICLEKGSISDLKKSLNKHYRRFKKTYLLPVFLDNHDMDRFLFRCKNNIEKLKQAARLQCSIAQPMIIYYGTELGLSQKNSIWCMKEHGDILAREPMPWEKIKNENELYYFYRNLIQKRMK